MPRQPRLEYPRALYHVMSRGDQRDDIFLSDVDRHDFIKTLAEACQKTGWQVHAFCLMRNHYHLVLETPDANLVAGMAWLQSTRDPDGQITTWTRQADANEPTVLSLGYDSADQLLSAILTTNTANGAVLSQYLYGYDPAGNRLSEEIQSGTNNPPAVTGAAYNNLNQLTNLSGSGGQMLFSGSLDKPGTVSVNGVPAVVNPHTTNFTGYASVSPGTNVVQVVAADSYGNSRTNRYQIVVTNNGVAQTITYDLNGNEVSAVTGSSTNTYEWDGADRLTAINVGTNRSEFTYDGLGRRVQIVEKQNGTVVSTKKFVWVGMQISEERDPTGAAVTKRFFGQGQVDGTTNLYYARDHLGSVREITDSTGAIRARYDYGPYGNQTKLSGDLDSDFAFTSDYYHQTSRLYLTMYRAYDANTGQWLNRDPIKEAGGLNLYAYVANNPINAIDPLGLWNLWNPATWGVSTGAGTSIWNSLNPLDGSAGWGGFSLETASEADAAFLDGINPFGNPFASMGLYDPCDKSFQWSRRIGGWTRDIELTLAPVGLVHYAGDLPLIGRGSFLFGKGTGLLNNNAYVSDIFRIGWGYKQEVGSVFRAVVGGNRTELGKAISRAIPAFLRHFDIYY